MELQSFYVSSLVVTDRKENPGASSSELNFLTTIRPVNTRGAH